MKRIALGLILVSSLMSCKDRHSETNSGPSIVNESYNPRAQTEASPPPMEEREEKQDQKFMPKPAPPPSGEKSATADLKDGVSSSAAVDNPNDKTHRFIRTADLRFKVANVLDATYEIENIIGRQGGFVTYTNLRSHVNRTSQDGFTEDSLLETTYYIVENDMEVRVPNTALDTTLRMLSKHMEYLDYRVISAEDVSIDIASNNLTQNRYAKSWEGEADEAKVANMRLNDRIKFSNISLHFYGHETAKREMVLNHYNIRSYQPSFWTQIKEALSSGGDLLKSLIVGIVHLWSIILFIVLAYIGFRAYRKSKAKA